MGQLEQFLSDIAPNGDWQPLIDYINQNYVSKSKIKDQIREMEDKMQEDKVDDFGIHSIGWAVLDYCCDIFKKLLGEEDE